MGHTATARDGTGGHPHGRCSHRHGRESEGPILRYKDATVEPIPFELGDQALPHPTLAGQAGFVPGIDKTGGVANFTQLPTFGSFSVRSSRAPPDHRFLMSGVGARPAADVYANQCDPYRRGPDGAVIEPKQTNSCWPPLVLPTSDGEFERLPDDYSCIAYHGSRFALSHSGSARSELNKNPRGEAQPGIRALALLQSKLRVVPFPERAGRRIGWRRVGFVGKRGRIAASGKYSLR